ncbi:MAG TPA: hypothetical protein VF635_06410 [Propionibacteriaceae bacterium]
MKVRTLVGIVAVSSTLLAGGVSTVASAKPSPSVCYEVENQYGEWKSKDQGCDGKIVAPSGGVHGISITVDGVKQVLYSASPDGVSFESGDNGDKVNGSNPTKKLRAALSPRKTRNLVYTVTYDDPINQEEVEETNRNNKLVGDGDNVINTISIKISNK